MTARDELINYLATSTAAASFAGDMYGLGVTDTDRREATDMVDAAINEALAAAKAEPAAVEGDLYFCPTAREVESATGGGFDTCCAHPELHVPMPDNEANAAVSQALSDAAKERFALEQQVARIREYLETSDDDGMRTRERVLGLLDQAGVPSTVAKVPSAPTGGFRWHVLSQCPDEAACPIHGLNEEPDGTTGHEDLPELTREDAIEAMQDTAIDLYRAEDRLAFVREMCDAADRNGQQVTTEQVRAWTQYEGCGGAIVLPEDEQQRLKAAMELHSLTGRIIDRAQAERWKAAGRCGTCGFDGDRAGCQDCGADG